MSETRDEIRSALHGCFNKVDRIMANSTWIEGEVPSLKEIYAEIYPFIAGAIGGSVLARGGIWSGKDQEKLEEICEDITKRIYNLIKRKLTGK